MRRRQSGEEISCDPIAGERAQALSSADLTGAAGAWRAVITAGQTGGGGTVHLAGLQFVSPADALLGELARLPNVIGAGEVGSSENLSPAAIGEPLIAALRQMAAKGCAAHRRPGSHLTACAGAAHR